MNRSDALSVLSKSLERYSAMSWAELADATNRNHIDDFEVTSETEITYQIEVNFVWDLADRIRILGMIDDGGWTAFAPIGQDLLISKSEKE